jgi:hypothetical protein
MALNSANAVFDMLDRAWRIDASVFIALTTTHQLQCRPEEKDLWGQLSQRTAGLIADR